MFSPYYAWARRHGTGDPFRHVALNVALYGERRRWALTERGAGALRRGADFLSIGPSALSWHDGVLTIEINEVAAPLPSRIRGTVRIRPTAIENRVIALDAAGRHRWSPIAPCARAEVALRSPALHWTGPAYVDTNNGDAPLEGDFIRWDWSRAVTPTGTAVLYEVDRRDASRLSLAMHYAAPGGVQDIPPPKRVPLPRTAWRVERSTRADAEARVTRTLEDTPFYARSVLTTQLLGEDLQAVHESLSLDRFRAPWVQAMLPFRMPRAIPRF